MEMSLKPSAQTEYSRHSTPYQLVFEFGSLKKSQDLIISYIL